MAIISVPFKHEPKREGKPETSTPLAASMAATKSMDGMSLIGFSEKRHESPNISAIKWFLDCLSSASSSHLALAAP